MKAIILAGGFGTRISEETDNKPKPMILIDDQPIIWHIMNTCATQGIKEFVKSLEISDIYEEGNLKHKEGVPVLSSYEKRKLKVID